MIILDYVFHIILWAGLLLLGWIDSNTGYLPQSLTYPLLLLGGLRLFFIPNPTHYLIAGICSFFCLLLFRWMTYQYYRKEAFGMGDVILATIFGVWGGLFKCVMALYFGIILAAVIGLFLIGIRIKKRHESIPLGPFLIAGWAGIHLWPL